MDGDSSRSCRRRSGLWASLIGISLSFVGGDPLFDGPYTLVNKKNGNRIFAQKGYDDDVGFGLLDFGPIYNDQKWRFARQGDSTYTIANEFDGRRLLAHPTGKLGAAMSGPITEPEKWQLLAQDDGSYLIRSATTRKMLVAQDGGKVVLLEGPIIDEQKWWLLHLDGQEAKQKGQDISRLKADMMLEAETRAKSDQEVIRLQAQLRQALQRTQKLEEELSRRSSVVMQAGSSPKSWSFISVVILGSLALVAFLTGHAQQGSLQQLSDSKDIQLPCFTSKRTYH